MPNVIRERRVKEYVVLDPDEEIILTSFDDLEIAKEEYPEATFDDSCIVDDMDGIYSVEDDISYALHILNKHKEQLKPEFEEILNRIKHDLAIIEIT